MLNKYLSQKFRLLLNLLAGVVILTFGQSMLEFKSPEADVDTVLDNAARTLAVGVGGVLVTFAVENFQAKPKDEGGA